ncbi:hypothetical protein SDC9_174549 [bioreactor metagenome]|uniref:Uncharacterized protein n=1 Tax=bioreactor metagenome TaxID=1076179 RepID=A0A645GMM5_9ZZZZ
MDNLAHTFNAFLRLGTLDKIHIHIQCHDFPAGSCACNPHRCISQRCQRPAMRQIIEISMLVRMNRHSKLGIAFLQIDNLHF